MADAAREEQLLRSSPLFGGMDQATARSLVGQMKRRELARGETIFNEGDDGHALYVVVKGKIKLARTARDGRENLLALLGVGDMLGELSVFDPGPRLSRAHAVEDSIVYELPKSVLDVWLDDHLEMSRHMLRALAQRIRRMSNTMADLVFSDVPGRVAKAILDLGHRFGRMERGHVTVRHGLTQEELAQLVGASRETVNKALADFASRGWIDVHIGAVEVYEPERLRARSR
ncbi:Crp/Fnr family transcriptional regulator [Demequina lignilytica]|uniref:CRP-like cAMP-activated global transcriptional regulator n=1 Tax=Demequina lignilytica TaxID=3051663 RepID=A0AAW7M4Y6_9MICO|nr:MULTISPECIES: Crp/Fnr family transcriptional regulator [unclassified Demequina]MDN4477989.1 Crp/Fnr family transcriptional regulator [Demequina sp. SYSU T00039-1]MDN4484232.1 Crp/Fnr family transcriptional regulator [Demequina sp. SYSU T0a273]MDN4487898.1 Crp/Fnr family transcriptional regulator [Demequina sp. SYSU T00039]MDN4490719.1 Crp/Fnr family transcriptional regulator [Demequina sp. SYSU T00068]